MQLSAVDPCGIGFEMPAGFVKEAGTMNLPGAPAFDGKTGWSESDCARLRAAALAKGLIQPYQVPAIVTTPTAGQTVTVNASGAASTDFSTVTGGASSTATPAFTTVTSGASSTAAKPDTLFGMNKYVVYAGAAFLVFLIARRMKNATK